VDEPVFPDDLDALHALVAEGVGEDVWIGFTRVRHGAPPPPLRVADVAAVLADAGFAEAGRRDVDGVRYAVRFAPAPARRARAPRRVPEGPFEEPVLPAEYEQRLRDDPRAAAFFNEQPPRYRRAAIWWVASGKAEETRERRIAGLIEACARGERLMQIQRNL
jgi:hypothetical protein